MLKVYQFHPVWGLLDGSPFCAKLLAWLKLAGVEHETRNGVHHMKRSPKGKMPYVEFDDGTIVGDSNFVIERLTADHNDPLDGDLNPQQKAITHLVRRMLDENLYWCIVYFRWIDRDNFDNHTVPAFFGRMPAWQRAIIPGIVRKKIAKSLHGQGVGRHSRGEIGHIGQLDLQSLIELLGDQPYFFGDRPHAIDVYVYAFVSAILRPPHQSPMQQFAKGTPLDAHCQRMEEVLK
ncbi:MAG: hypothetical protein DHS20C11_33950 [Lysobacteraceae bacterium]|nr:MAG: hypothetical protein DHS20C11_33950 [Xanthomonadaceae bacterium]